MGEQFDDIFIGKGCVIVSSDSDRPVTDRTPYKTGVATVDTTDTPWSFWGTDNKMPVEIADDIENSGVLSAGLDAKARIGTGKGMQPFLVNDIDSDGKEQTTWVKDALIHQWLEDNENFEFAFDSSYDKHAYGWCCGSYILDFGRKQITSVIRHDVFEARIAKEDDKGNSPYLYLSSDWSTAGAEYDPDKQLRIPLLHEGNEYNDLIKRLQSDPPEIVQYAFVNRTLRHGRHYYPLPLYRSGRAWIKIARSVPACLNALFKNQISIKYVVKIHPKFWEDKFGQVEWSKMQAPDRQAERLSKINDYHNKLDKWLTGEDASYKSLFTSGFVNNVSGDFVPHVQVEAIDDKLKDGKYLPESGAANSEILFALMINPALMGAGNPGGKAYGDTSGGSNVRESFLVQLMIMEAERRLNASVFNVVKKFNGWDKKIQGENGENGRLVFRYPSGLLTTLDTGKSTKPENL